jgi:hypothetical protein
MVIRVCKSYNRASFKLYDFEIQSQKVFGKGKYIVIEKGMIINGIPTLGRGE